MAIWPFSTRITSLSYDSKHEHLAVALQSGNICIIERTSSVNDLPFVENVSSNPLVDVHAIDSNLETNDKQNGFLTLSNDGKIYRVKFNEQDISPPCFPQ